MIKIQDEIGALSGSARSDLQGMKSQFNVKVIFTHTQSKDDATARAKDCLSDLGPSGVCILVDPAGKLSSTQFGADTGIGSATEKLAARAGNPNFREGEWTEGVKAIINRTNEIGTLKVAAKSAVQKVVSNAQATIKVEPKVIIEHKVSVWPFFVFGLPIAALLVYVIIRTKKRGDAAVARAERAAAVATNEAAEAIGRNLKEEPSRPTSRERPVAESASVPPPRVSHPSEPPIVTPPPRCGECGQTPCTGPTLCYGDGINYGTVNPARRAAQELENERRRRIAAEETADHQRRMRRRAEERASQPVVVVQSQPDILTPLVVASALNHGHEHHHHHHHEERRRERTPEPARQDTSFFSSDDDDRRRGGGGETSSFNSDSGSSDSGGGGDTSGFGD